MHPLIEKSAFKRGRYIGYANGVWNIEKNGRMWRAVHRDDRSAPVVRAATLRAIGDTLAKLVKR